MGLGGTYRLGVGGECKVIIWGDGGGGGGAGHNRLGPVFIGGGDPLRHQAKIFI